jgi:ABC-type transport system substrate-binding protein
VLRVTEFAIYAQILRLMQDDLPYIPLYFSDETVALSARFALPGYISDEADDTPNVPYAMFIKAAS